jgi:putative transposase
VPGLFTELGCTIHWATPYSGQSKPIERAFRDMCDNIAKDPRFDGAYTGNRPEAKPEDYGSRAIPLEDFLRVLAEGIEEHNLRQGRRSEVAWGRSFAEVFDEAYATAPIRKATEAQRRLWLLGAEGVRADSKSGLIKFQGNEYWSDWMHVVAGERLIVRFDPADFFSGLHVYSAENGYLGHAACKSKVGFFDSEEARMHSRLRRDWMNREKAALAAHRRMTAAQVGMAMDAVAPEPSLPPEAKVVRATFGAPKVSPRAGTPAFAAEDVAQVQAVIVADLSARRAGLVPAATEETPRERFKRALALEARLAAGEPATAEQQRWLHIYQGSAECMAERMLWDDFGDTIFG